MMYNFTNIYSDGTDYWIGGLDANKDKQLQWMTGNLMKRINTNIYRICSYNIALSTHDYLMNTFLLFRGAYGI